MGERVIEEYEQDRVLGDLKAEVSTHLWYVWTEVALDHERFANAARRDYLDAGSGVGHLESELKACLVVVAAVTHALDALQRELADLVSPLGVETDARRRPAAFAAVFQALVATFAHPGFDATLRDGLQQLYQLRNEVVHQRPALGPIVVHPVLGHRTTPSAARYTAERASWAIDLLFQVFALIRDVTSRTPDIGTAWARTWRASLDELTAGRDTRSAAGERGAGS